MRFAHTQSIGIFVLVAAALNIIFFHGLGSQEFVFSGDQFFRFNGYEAFINSFFLRKPNDLGVLNGWQFAAQFWDALYYQAVYSIGLTPQLSEKVLFFLVLVLSMYLSFLGFGRIAPRFGIRPGSLSVHAIVFWYCFNPYTLELWHGGAYYLCSALTYSLAPLIYYHFSEALFSTTDKTRFLLFALLLAVASSTFWLVAPLLLFLALYAMIRVSMRMHSWRLALGNALLLGLAYLPLVSFILVGILHEYFSNTGDNNASFTPSFGNMQGGIWYQLMMLFSWGIYTVWTPRSLYPFGDYFFSPAYLTGIILLYVAVVIGLILYFADAKDALHPNGKAPIGPIRLAVGKCYEGMKRIGVLASPTYRSVEATHQAIALVSLFALSVFLAKGAQRPLGGIFLYLYSHAPFFKVFRTPDIRFGFTIVLSLAILMLFVSQWYRKHVFFFGVLGITFLLAWPFFSGSAVRGEEKPNLYYDRIVHIPKTYSNLATYINQHEVANAYVLPIPPVEYGNYVLDQGEHFVGQDMVSKIIKAPFAYVASSGGMAAKTYGILKDIIETQQFERLRDFPIRYVLLRNDICPECPPASAERLARVSHVVYRDAVFSLYEMHRYRAIIDSPNVTYERVNPTKYRVTFSHVSKPQELRLLQNFSTSWNLFATKNYRATNCGKSAQNDFSATKECLGEEPLLQSDDWRYLRGPSVFESTHQLKWGYANSWVISAAELQASFPSSYYSVNEDGSLNFTLTAYYRPEARYLLAAFVSLAAALISLAVVMRLRWRGLFS